MSDAPLGSFEEHVLLAVLRLPDGAWGMRVRREIEACTGREVAIGAVYSTLDRLEAKDLAVSERADRGGRSRRLFAVTPKGKAALDASRRMRTALWSGVELEPAPGRS